MKITKTIVTEAAVGSTVEISFQEQIVIADIVSELTSSLEENRKVENENIKNYKRVIKVDSDVVDKARIVLSKICGDVPGLEQVAHKLYTEVETHNGMDEETYLQP